MYEYKVFTERDTRLTGRFDPKSLETALNSYAADGWRVVEGLVVSTVWKNSKTEIMILLERQLDSSPQ
jgi:hypothetical protein